LFNKISKFKTYFNDRYLDEKKLMPTFQLFQVEIINQSIFLFPKRIYKNVCSEVFLKYDVAQNKVQHID